MRIVNSLCVFARKVIQEAMSIENPFTYEKVSDGLPVFDLLNEQTPSLKNTIELQDCLGMNL